MNRLDFKRPVYQPSSFLNALQFILPPVLNTEPGILIFVRQ